MTKAVEPKVEPNEDMNESEWIPIDAPAHDERVIRRSESANGAP